MSYEILRRIFSLAYFIIPVALIPFGFYEWHMVLISLLFYYIVVFIGVECGLHRYFTHNSYKTTRFWEYFLSIFPIFLTIGSPIAWTAIHRAHHRKSDTELDPHSPKYIPLWRIFTVTWSADHLSLKVGFARGVDFKFQKFLHDHYYKLVSLYILLLGLIGLEYIVYFWALPSLVAHIYQQVVNTLGHSAEYNEDTKDYSRNIKFLGFIFPIIGYHHQHHLVPQAHRIGKGLRHLEPDFPAFLIEKIFMKKQ